MNRGRNKARGLGYETALGQSSRFQSQPRRLTFHNWFQGGSH